jgi:hypothetical protein
MIVVMIVDEVVVAWGEEAELAEPRTWDTFLEVYDWVEVGSRVMVEVLRYVCVGWVYVSGGTPTFIPTPSSLPEFRLDVTKLIKWW